MKRYLPVYIISIAVIAGLLIWMLNIKRSEETIRKVEAGWYSTIKECLADSSKSPRLIVVTRAGWSRYERNTYDNSEVKKLIAPLPRVKLDWSEDTAKMDAWKITEAPSLILTTSQGELITKLMGPRDISIISKAISRSIEFPFSYSELSQRTDTESVLRCIEVAIELGEFETAAVKAERFLGNDTSSISAKGQYLHAYAIAELGEIEKSQNEAKVYLSRYPKGEDRAALLWILSVLDLQNGKDASAKKYIQDMITSDSSSPFSRQAVLAYSIEYLARGKKNLSEADNFLTSAIAESSPWTYDFLLARSSLRFASPSTVELGLQDLAGVAKSNSDLAEDAQDRLVMLSMPPNGDALRPNIILMFQELARSSGNPDCARFNLARLYIFANDENRAREEAQTLSVKGGEYSGDAMLLLGTMKLEFNKEPKEAVKIFEDLIAKYPERETFWAGKYGLARALFFSGDVERAKKEISEVLVYLEGRRYLADAFLTILPRPMRPIELKEQFQDFAAKLESIEKEEGGKEVFGKLLEGVLASSKGDTVTAGSKFNEIIEKNPASSVVDDAYFELAKIYVREGNLDKTKEILTKIITVYKHSDQYESAKNLLEMINQSQGNRR